MLLTTCTAPCRAATSAGLSATRRSRRSHSSAVVTLFMGFGGAGSGARLSAISRDEAACGNAAASMATLWAGKQCKAAQLLPILLNDGYERDTASPTASQAAPGLLAAAPATVDSAKRARGSGGSFAS